MVFALFKACKLHAEVIVLEQTDERLLEREESGIDFAIVFKAYS